MENNNKRIVRKYIMGYDLEEYPYELLYRKIYKIPVRIYFEGLLHICKSKLSIDDIKEITREIIEDSIGIELTFTDEDWGNLKLEEKEIKYTLWGKENISTIRELNTNKKYMKEFFELC